MAYCCCWEYLRTAVLFELLCCRVKLDISAEHTVTSKWQNKSESSGSPKRWEWDLNGNAKVMHMCEKLLNEDEVGDQMCRTVGAKALPLQGSPSK